MSNFTTLKTEEIEEIQCTLIELEHTPSGAHVLHLACDDPENFFNICLPTRPTTSNGVAHILEHVVLCGSKKFPLHDPFFSMTRRSLNTFMNAMTGADFTCYPAASLVPKDFYNLLEVYLDAVFHPLLTKLSFLQEGHRLEFQKPEDPNSPLMFKGIVFNEMKGALATGEARLAETLMAALFPDTTYGVNSGGDPHAILSLTYDELVSFHKTFYHPSRALFFFYGNLPLEQHLDFLDKHALAGVERLSLLPPLPKQPRFSERVEKVETYPIAKEERLDEKSYISFGWLCGSILEQKELLALNVLEIVLLGSDAAPLKRALLKSGLCKQVESHLDSEMNEIPFIITCKGCREGDAAAVEKIVYEVLENSAKKGLSEPLIEGALHQLELARTEIKGGNAPYGLHLCFSSALLKLHGGNPEDGLRIHSLFSQLRESLCDPQFLPRLIEKYFLHNTHAVRLEMNPSQTQNEKEREIEQQRLESICGKLEDRDVSAILTSSQALETRQEEDPSSQLEMLPQVTLSDISKQGEEFDLEIQRSGPLEVFHHNCFTNEIVYADLIFDLPELASEDLPYVRLFANILPQIGCGGRSYKEHLDYLIEHTGGVGVSLDLSQQAEGADQMRPSLCLHGKALYRKKERLFPVFYDLMTSADFTDLERITSILSKHYHAIENGIQKNSLRYAVNLASKGHSMPANLTNQWFGLDYFHALKKIYVDFEKKPSQVVEKLEQMRDLCLKKRGGELVLACDQKLAHEMQQTGFYGLDQLDPSDQTRWRPSLPREKSLSQARITASPVAFTALLFKTIGFTHPDAAALSVASEIMENRVLHKRIREQGGAYGSGAVHGLISGEFYFYTYRDPYLAKSVEACFEAIDKVAGGEFTDRDLEEALLGLFQEIDSPSPPGVRAITAYNRLRSGRTSEKRAHFRERLLHMTKEEISRAVALHLQSGIEQATLVTFAGKDLLERENSLLKHPLPIYEI